MLPIRCPYCGYDGSDLSIGRKMPFVEYGVVKMFCSKCGREFNC